MKKKKYISTMHQEWSESRSGDYVSIGELVDGEIKLHDDVVISEQDTGVKMSRDPKWAGRNSSWEVCRDHEWGKWREEIPFIKWPSDWEVKAIPPAGGAIIRYEVKTPNCELISIYLDCYDLLGIMGQPYWEVYCFNGEPERCLMNETDELLKLIGDCRKE